MDNAQIEAFWAAMNPSFDHRIANLRARGTRFAHYTSAETGIAILRSGRMLLRNSILMNDFSEVDHGMRCLSTAWLKPQGKRLQKLLGQIDERIPKAFEKDFNDRFPEVRQETYIASISEHGDPVTGLGPEDDFGRLSMWRAYGRQNGIAFIFNQTAFVTDANPFNAFSVAVNYATPEQYLPDFIKLVDGVEANIEAIKALGPTWVHATLMAAFRFIIQATKHPSFHEEREWRVIYAPTIVERDGLMTDEQRERIATEVMVLGGVPQRVYAIPFKSYPDEGFVGATIPELIDAVLIGPSLDAYAIQQAFISELRERGVEDAHNRVRITGVPLRQ